MSEIGGRLGCARVIRGSACSLPKLHSVHVGSGWKHDYVKPERQKRREQMAAHSDKQQRYYDDVRIPAVEAIQGTRCEARVSDLIGVSARYLCTGVAVDIHEIVRRSQAGSLQSAVALGVMRVCRACHAFISENPRIARDLGYSLSRKDVGL